MTTRYAAITVGLIFGAFVLAAPPAQALTMKECSAKYKAAKDAGTLNGQKWNDFRKAECGSDAATAPAATPTTAAPPAKQDSSTKPGTAPVVAAPSTKQQPAAKPTTTVAAAPTGANEFSTEAQAKARCPSDTVVWANLGTKIYHFAGSKTYGTTKKGAYMCEKDAVAAAIRAAKNEKHP
jgi:hypothetical protein